MKNALERARALMSDVTPLNRDCGRLCGQACCQSDETEENGMLLFPGEEAYYTHDTNFELREDGRILCRGSCRRENRPMACRMFPLIILSGGVIKRDIRAWPVCPLMKEGMKAYRADFVERLRQAAQILLADEAQAAFIARLTQVIGEYEALKKMI